MDFWQRFTKTEKLGEGTYGCVFKGHDNQTDKDVAIKYMKVFQDEEGISQTTLREISLLKSLDNPNIIEIVDFSIDKNSIILVTPYMDMDLHSFISKKRHYLSINLVKVIGFQIIAGLHYLHINHIMHRDMKPENVLISLATGIIKICDFGLSRSFTIPIKCVTAGIATIWYRAPEVILHNKVYDTEIDIWAAGCIIAEMVKGSPIFVGDSDIDMIYKIFETLGTPDDETLNYFHDIQTHKISVKKFPGQSIGDLLNSNDVFLVDLLKKMLAINPLDRITARDALLHPFFNDVDPVLRNRVIPTL